MTDTCVCCGGYVPEGRMVCPLCEAGNMVKSKKSKALSHLMIPKTKKRKNSIFNRYIFQSLLTFPIK